MYGQADSQPPFIERNALLRQGLHAETPQGPPHLLEHALLNIITLGCGLIDAGSSDDPSVLAASALLIAAVLVALLRSAVLLNSCPPCQSAGGRPGCLATLGLGLSFCLRALLLLAVTLHTAALVFCACLPPSVLVTNPADADVLAAHWELSDPTRGPGHTLLMLAPSVISAVAFLAWQGRSAALRTRYAPVVTTTSESDDHERMQVGVRAVR